MTEEDGGMKEDREQVAGSQEATRGPHGIADPKGCATHGKYIG